MSFLRLYIANLSNFVGFALTVTCQRKIAHSFIHSFIIHSFILEMAGVSFRLSCKQSKSYTFNVTCYISSACHAAHMASTEAFYVCLSTATPRTSSHEPHPPSFISPAVYGPSPRCLWSPPLSFSLRSPISTPSLYRSFCPALECGQ